MKMMCGGGSVVTVLVAVVIGGLRLGDRGGERKSLFASSVKMDLSM